MIVNHVILDYLFALGQIIMSEFQKHHSNKLLMESMQWCVTVPSIWIEKAKQHMKTCMANVGFWWEVQMGTRMQVPIFLSWCLNQKHLLTIAIQI
jgi:hypothetical protein